MIKGVIFRVASLLTVAVMGIELLSVTASPPNVKPAYQKLAVSTGETLAMPWPGYGQAALGSPGFGVLATDGQKSPVPIASTAKVITALAVLNQRPLKPEEAGPSIAIEQADVDSFNSYLARDGSVVPVEPGVNWTQRQALEALLVPSANNIADTLARWAFGSIDKYISYANNYVQSLGLTQTSVDDASGFSPRTVSTAQELTKLALTAMDNPVFAEIVAQQQTSLPIAGVVRNTNRLLGDGIIGIKTGNTEEAGGCFILAAERMIGNQKVIVIGTVLGAPNLTSAMNASKELAVSSDRGFRLISPVAAGQPVVDYHSPWGAKTVAVAGQSQPLLAWQDQPVSVSYDLRPLKPALPSGTRVGEVTFATETKSIKVPLLTQASLGKPSLAWKLRNPSF